MEKKDTIVTEYVEFCLFCGKPYEIEGHHLICGQSKRNKGTDDKLMIPLCTKCHHRIHNDGMCMFLSKALGQAIYEHTHTREEFIGRYGRSYF